MIHECARNWPTLPLPEVVHKCLKAYYTNTSQKDPGAVLCVPVEDGTPRCMNMLSQMTAVLIYKGCISYA